MEKKGFKWQMIPGALFMLVIIIALFMPALNISGEKYLDIVVDVNKYAKDEDSKTASDAEVDKKVIDKYKENTSKWDDKVKEFDDEIEKNDKGKSISQLKLIKWLLTADEEVDDIKGIEKESDGKAEDNSKNNNRTEKRKKVNKKSNRKSKKKGNNTKKSQNSKESKNIKKLQNSNIKIIFRIMALLLILPVIMSIISIILMVVMQKTNPIVMLATGVCTVITRAIYIFAMPSVIWGTIDDYIKSFTLIDSKILAIDGVGKYTISKIMSNCSGASIYITIISGIFLVIAGILFITALKPEMQVSNDESEWDIGLNDEFNGQQLYQSDVVQQLNNTQEKNLVGNTVAGNFDVMGDFKTAGEFTIASDDNIYSNTGKIYGINGQYKDFELNINTMEEVILGRDPSVAMLVFDYSKVSRKHCGIKYDSTTGRYYVTDYSSNGIELSDGTVAKKNQTVSVAAGTILYLADRHEAVRLG